MSILNNDSSLLVKQWYFYCNQGVLAAAAFYGDSVFISVGELYPSVYVEDAVSQALVLFRMLINITQESIQFIYFFFWDPNPVILYAYSDMIPVPDRSYKDIPAL